MPISARRSVAKAFGRTLFLQLQLRSAAMGLLGDVNLQYSSFLLAANLHFFYYFNSFFSFIFFLIPGMPKDYFCYLLGLSPLHVLTFFVISTVGRIPGTLLLTMQGQAIRSENYRAFFVVLGLLLLFLVVTLIYRDRIESWLKPPRKP